MKKERKAVLSLVLALIFCTLCACGSTGANRKDKNILKIVAFDGGYGVKWLETIAKNYEAYSGKKVMVDKMYIATKEPEIKSGACVYDIVFQAYSMFGSRNALCDITDVLNSAPEGEEKTILEKMNISLRDYLNEGTTENPSYTHLPWSSTMMGILYNETVMNKYLVDNLGKPNWSIPRTSEELLSLCKRCKDAGIYAFVNSNSLGTYSVALVNTWWAQYEGYENYMNYYKGTYVDDLGVAHPNDYRVGMQQGRKEALMTYEDIIKKQNGYIHPDSDTMEYIEAQTEFVGVRVGKNKTPSAMTINGDWIENESSVFLKESGDTIKIMPTPIISSLANKIGLSGDAELCELIDFVDGKIGEVSFEYTPRQLEKVKDARNMLYTFSNDHVMVVPKTTKKLDTVKDFLIFLFSNINQATYARTLNGLHMPFGYDIKNDSTIKFTSLTSSLADIYDNDTILIMQDKSSLLSYRGGLTMWNSTNRSVLTNYDQGLFKGIFTGESYYDDNIKYLQEEWSSILMKSGLKQG